MALRDLPAAPANQEEGDDKNCDEVSVTPRVLATVRMELRTAVTDLSVRGLKLAAKWAAEQLGGLRQASSSAVTAGAVERGEDENEEEYEEEYEEGERAPPLDLSDAFLVAKAYFDTGEYQRAAHVLKSKENKSRNDDNGSTTTATINQEELFLRCYATYLAGEKAKEERMIEITDQLDRCQVVNKALQELVDELGPLHTSQALDGFNLYIYGVALKEMEPFLLHQGTPTPSKVAAAGAAAAAAGGGGEGGEGGSAAELAGGGGGGGRGRGRERSTHRPSAKIVLLESVCAYPFNWSAWLDLAEVMIEDGQQQQQQQQSHVRSSSSSSSKAGGGGGGGVGGGWLGGGGTEGGGDGAVPMELQEQLSSSWMFDFFQAHLLLEQHQSEQALLLLNRLLQVFPTSSYLLAQRAIARYNHRDFEGAQAGFRQLHEQDPFRLENMERYSDILYVKESRAELSHLAHLAVRNDKYRPETCCIIGNYYSLKGQHERAVMYFQRALKLNRKFLFAWTLMGHGFLEMKNTGAAIEAYRRAVDINPRDYRAWYGLGQTYELLQMYFYAIYYYRKAATLRPFDARMWCALGVCYENLDRRAEAIKCHERAVCNNDREGIATAKLARLYRDDEEESKAARCYQRHLETRQGYQTDGSSDTVDALLFLAHYHIRGRDLHTASLYCNRLLDMGGREQEEAKALLREIRSMEGQEEDEEVGGGERGGRESIGAFRVFENEESFMDSSFSSTEASRVEATPDFNSGTSSRRMTRQQAAAATAAAAAAVAGGDRRGRRVTGARSPEI
ncbi:anaphase promoting complex subunit 8 [Nannochloropsis oceanica]